jgi:mRNA interferase RelE/StbE
LPFSVLLHSKANLGLNKFEETTAKQVRERLRELRDDPEKLGPRLRFIDYWRNRIGDYHAIYEIDYKENCVIVLYIGHRKNVYDDFPKAV